MKDHPFSYRSLIPSTSSSRWALCFLFLFSFSLGVLFARVTSPPSSPLPHHSLSISPSEASDLDSSFVLDYHRLKEQKELWDEQELEYEVEKEDLSKKWFQADQKLRELQRNSENSQSEEQIDPDDTKPAQTKKKRPSKVKQTSSTSTSRSLSPSLSSSPPAEVDPDSIPNDWSHLTFWSTDFHITPIADLKFLFQSFGIRIIDKSLSGHCHFQNSCARDLKVLNRDNGYHIGDRPQDLSERMFNAYKDDAEFRKVDAIVCFHPIVTCQLYMPFNKSILMISSTRYEHGQEKPEHWRRFNYHMELLYQHPSHRHLIAGNSVYDAEYIRYFTNIPAEYIPSFCGQITARYNPIRKSYLLGHMHVSDNKDSYWHSGSLVWGRATSWINEAKTKAGQSSMEFHPINSLYRHYEYQDLANHLAMIHIPYQVSVMSFFEQYRMNLPMFFPSLDFLVQLELDHAVVSERTWGRIRGRGSMKGSDIPKHPDYNRTEWDPNDDVNPNAIRHWLGMSDFYIKPHIQYFDSWDDLIQKLATTDLNQVSQKMADENAKFEPRLKNQWKKVFHKLFHNRPNDGYPMPSGTYQEAMKDLYGV